MGNSNNFCNWFGDSKNKINLHEQEIKQYYSYSDSLKKAKNANQKGSKTRDLFQKFVKNVRLERINKKREMKNVQDIIQLIDLNIQKYGNYIKNQNYINRFPPEVFEKYRYFQKINFLDEDLSPPEMYRLTRLPLEFFSGNGIYKGHWTPLGERNGHGEYLMNEECLIIGYWSDNEFYHGVKIYENGCYYMGEFENLLAEGEGKFYDKYDNLIYEGSFVKDKFNGKGKLNARLKIPFVCNFSKNKNTLKENESKFDNINASIKKIKKNEKIENSSEKEKVIVNDKDNYEEIESIYNDIKEIEDFKKITIYAEFEDNKINGRGSLEVEDYFKYEGDFLHNRFHGSGKMQFLNDQFSSRQFTGEFKENCLDGKGIFSFKSGSYFEGYYLKNKKNGFGYYYIDNNISFEANWSNGKINGNCSFYNKEKNIKKKLIFRHGHLKSMNEERENSNDQFGLEVYNELEDMILNCEYHNEYTFNKDNFLLDYDYPLDYKDTKK
jgi:hypothetical protein